MGGVKVPGLSSFLPFESTACGQVPDSLASFKSAGLLCMFLLFSEAGEPLLDS